MAKSKKKLNDQILSKLETEFPNLQMTDQGEDWMYGKNYADTFRVTWQNIIDRMKKINLEIREIPKPISLKVRCESIGVGVDAEVQFCDDSDKDLILKIKATTYHQGHRYKQCYFEPDKIIPDTTVCTLPCDLWCPERIKNLNKTLTK